MPTPPNVRRWMVVAAVALLANLVLVTAVVAGHRFGDVSNANIFHDDITWLADNDITRGCNPPTNNLFCPKDNVTREQMAAFMHRLAGAFGGAADTTPIDNLIEVPQTVAGAEVLSVDVTAKSLAEVVLSANVSLTTSGAGTFQIFIVRDSCAGQRLNDGAVWTTAGDDLQRFTMAVNAADTITGPTTYKVCALRGFGAEANASRSAVTAFWTPAG